MIPVLHEDEHEGWACLSQCTPIPIFGPAGKKICESMHSKMNDAQRRENLMSSKGMSVKVTDAERTAEHSRKSGKQGMMRVHGETYIGGKSRKRRKSRTLGRNEGMDKME